MLNEQLRILICAEIALHVICPNAARRFRKVYDRIGPMLARLVVNAWLADGLYVSLKPLEWSAKLLLWSIFGQVRPVVEKLYAPANVPA